MKTIILHRDNEGKNALNQIYQYMKPGRPYELTIKERRKNKTRDQLAYFHLICDFVADDIGYTMDEVKKSVKWHKGLRDEWRDMVTQEVTSMPRSLADYYMDELRDFISQAKEYLQQIVDWRIPDSHEIPEEELLKYQNYGG